MLLANQLAADSIYIFYDLLKWLSMIWIEKEMKKYYETEIKSKLEGQNNKFDQLRDR